MAVSDLLLNILSRSDKRALESTADELDKLGRKADDAGRKFDGMAKESGHVDKQIEQTRTKIRELGEEFDKTGKKELLPQLRRERGSLAALEKIKKDLTSTLEEAGLQAGKGFVSNMTAKVVEFAGSNVMGTAIVGGIVLASPAIGAATGAAISLGLGGGVLAAGIVAAAQDDRVGHAWSTMLSGAGEKFRSESTILVDPLIKAADTVGGAFDRVISRSGAALATLAPRVNSIAEGAGRMIENIFKGGNFDRAIALSGKLLDKLGAELPNFGNAVSDMLGSIAAGGPGIQQFWQDFLTGTQKAVVGVGNVVEALAKAYDFLGGEKSIGKRINDTVWDDIIPALDDAGHWLDDHIGKPINDFFGQHNRIDTKPVDDLSGSTKKLTEEQERAKTAAEAHARALSQTRLGATLLSNDFTSLSSQISKTAQTSDMLAGQMADKAFNSMMSLDQATLGFAQSQTQMGESIEQNGRELDIHTTKGQANRQSILAAVQANMAEYDANIRSGMGAEQAAKAYDTNTAALEAQLRKAGFTQGAIDGLIGKYRNVPDDVDTNIKLYGLTQAIQGLDDVIRRANGLDGRVATMTVQEIHRTTYTTDYAPSNYFRGLAAGGRVGSMARGGRYMVGENGPEEVSLPDGAYVVPNHRMPAAGGPDVLDAVDVPLNFRDAVTGEVVQAALLRLSKKRGYRTVAQLLPVGPS